MEYRLDPRVFKKRLLELGFKSLSEFASKSKIHRNTLRNLLSGKTIFSNAFDALARALKVDPFHLLSPHAVLPGDVCNIEELAPLIARLVREDENLGVFLIGSRLKKSAKKFSDWDLAVTRYPEPLSGREYLRLKRRIGELSENLVRNVDLVNLDQAPLWFLQNFEKKPLFLEGNKEAALYFMGVLDGIEKEQAA